MEAAIDLSEQTNESVTTHNAKEKPGSDLVLESDFSQLNDFSRNIKGYLQWLREPIKWVKPTAKAELESLAKSLGKDTIEQLKAIENTLGYPLKDKQKIEIIKWLSGNQLSKIKAGKKTELLKSLLRQEVYRMSINKICEWVNWVSTTATYINSGSPDLVCFFHFSVQIVGLQHRCLKIGSLWLVNL